MSSVVISHQDADGVFCTAIYLMKEKNEKCRCYFTSPIKLLNTICYSIIRNNSLDKLYVFDLSGNEKTLKASSIFDRAVWIDHHQWKDVKAPENVEVIVNSRAKSAARVVAEYFDIFPEWLGISEEIDTNSVVTREAEELRGIITMLKKKYRNKLLSRELFYLSKGLASHGLDVLLASKYRNLIKEYEAWMGELKEKIYPDIYQICNHKIAIIEEKEFFPVYLICNELKNHQKAPFDIILCIFRNGLTKLEFRTHTGFDVLQIARSYGGGGHKVASGASVKSNISKEEILHKIGELMKCNDEKRVS